LKAEDIRQRFNRIKNELTELEEEKKAISDTLRTRGEGEISILKKLTPVLLLE